MTQQPKGHHKASMTSQLQRLSDEMTTLIDEAGYLEVACSWYHDDDPQYGGPPTVDQLQTMAMRLRSTYMNIAQITGLDPCEQLSSTGNLGSGPVRR